MDRAQEVPYRGFVRLVSRCGRQVLLHDGTGERITLPGPSTPTSDPQGRFRLLIASSGDGAIVRGEEQLLVSDMLRKRFRSVEVDGAQKLFAEQPGGQLVWHESLLKNRRSKVLVMKSPTDSREFTTEVYIYAVRRGPSYTWWCAPWLRNAVVPNHHGDNWVGRNKNVWRAWMERCGIDEPEEHLLPSRYAMQKQLVSRGAPTEHAQGFPQEWGLLSVLFLVLCLQWGRQAPAEPRTRAPPKEPSGCSRCS